MDAINNRDLKRNFIKNLEIVTILMFGSQQQLIAWNYKSMGKIQKQLS